MLLFTALHMWIQTYRVYSQVFWMPLMFAQNIFFMKKKLQEGVQTISSSTTKVITF